MKPIVYAGVDPGMSKTNPGAWAIISEDLQTAAAWLWPEAGIPIVADMFRELVGMYDIRLCAIEYQQVFKGQGVSTSGKIMMNYGQWQGLIAGLGVPYEIHSPKKWQKAILDSAKGRKEIKAASTAFAKQRFPDVDISRVKDQGKADALNIALYARKIFHAH